MESRHQQAKEIFLDASELDEPAREEFLVRACGADADLRAEVDFLLRGHDRPKLLVDEPLLHSPRLTPFLAEAAEAEKLPAWIGKYRILRRVGEGGMGVVLEAEQANPKRRVALKMVRPGFFSPRMQRRLEREVQILARLQHPGIEQVFEADSVDFPHGRVPYFVAEFIDGLALTEYARENRLSVIQLVELLIKVCEAVQFAHQNLIIHRDLKPGNILVDPLSQPKVVDFGLARVLDASGGELTHVSGAGQVIGTLPYISPEQLEDNGPPPDTRADVYALGVILFEILSGQLPYDFVGKSAASAARTVRDHAPRSLGALDRALRGDVTTIVQKALAKEPADRYRSAGELAEDLRRYLRAEPILAHRPSAAYVVRKLIARHKLPAALLATLFVVLNVTAVTVTWLYLGQRAATLRAEELATQAAWDAAQAKYQAESAEALGYFFQSFVTERPGAEWMDYHRRMIDTLAARAAATFAGQPHAEARTRLSLGWAYLNRGDSAEAEEQMRAALRIWQAAHGEHDVWAITASVGLAGSLRARGALEEARQIAQAAWDTAQSLPPHCWRSKIDAANVLGLVSDDLGDAASAERLARETYTLVSEHIPNDAGTRGAAALNLADTLRGRNNSAAAEPFAREAYALIRAAFGDDHQFTTRALEVLESVWRTLGRYTDAEAVLLENHEALAQRPSADAVRVKRVAKRLAELYEAWDKPEPAAMWRARAAETQPAGAAPAAVDAQP